MPVIELQTVTYSPPLVTYGSAKLRFSAQESRGLIGLCCSVNIVFNTEDCDRPRDSVSHHVPPFFTERSFRLKHFRAHNWLEFFSFKSEAFQISRIEAQIYGSRNDFWQAHNPCLLNFQWEQCSQNTHSRTSCCCTSCCCTSDAVDSPSKSVLFVVRWALWFPSESIWSVIGGLICWAAIFSVRHTLLRLLRGRVWKSEANTHTHTFLILFDREIQLIACFFQSFFCRNCHLIQMIRFKSVDSSEKKSKSLRKTPIRHRVWAKESFFFLFIL